jgi:hypothetical protein
MGAIRRLIWERGGWMTHESSLSVTDLDSVIKTLVGLETFPEFFESIITGMFDRR